MPLLVVGVVDTGAHFFMMDNDFRQRWTDACQMMKQCKPIIERSAGEKPGEFKVNLAREWRLFLVKKVLGELVSVAKK